MTVGSVNGSAKRKMQEKPTIRSIRLINIEGHDDFWLSVELMEGSMLVDRSNLPSYVEEIFENTEDFDGQLLKMVSQGFIETSDPAIDVSKLT